MGQFQDDDGTKVRKISADTSLARADVRAVLSHPLVTGEGESTDGEAEAETEAPVETLEEAQARAAAEAAQAAQ